MYSTKFGIRTNYGWFKELLLELPGVPTTYITVEIISNERNGRYRFNTFARLKVFKSSKIQKIPIEFCFNRCMENLDIVVRNVYEEPYPDSDVDGFTHDTELCRATLRQCTLVIKGVIP